VTADNLEEKLQEYTEAVEQYEKDLAAWLEVFGPCHGKPCLTAPPEEEEPLPPLIPGPTSFADDINDWYEDEKQKDPVNEYLEFLWLIVMTLALLVEACSDEEEPTKSGGNPNHSIC
jgi:hypothetical protein